MLSSASLFIWNVVSNELPLSRGLSALITKESAFVRVIMSFQLRIGDTIHELARGRLSV